MEHQDQRNPQPGLDYVGCRPQDRVINKLFKTIPIMPERL